MTKDEALDLALEALEQGIDGQTSIQMDKAITAIKQARSAPVQEPVAFNAGVPPLYPEMKDGETISVKYTTPPAQPAPMTKDEALDLALEALESYHGYMEPLTTVFGGPRVPAEQSTTGKVEKAITALRTAIEQAEKQDGDCQQCGGQGCVACDARKQEQFGPKEILQMIVDRALEKPAAQRQWIGLTDEEHTQIAVDVGCMSSDWLFYGAAVERALKNKNT